MLSTGHVGEVVGLNSGDVENSYSTSTVNPIEGKTAYSYDKAIGCYRCIVKAIIRTCRWGLSDTIAGLVWYLISLMEFIGLLMHMRMRRIMDVEESLDTRHPITWLMLQLYKQSNSLEKLHIKFKYCRWYGWAS